ncbi:hypothetical protein E2C01_069114 [Portunus trituberculatus]|uniref:Uncharacterized protein n=1 Tax=Portunus trituberculatus TaxID=210409 RepID=A0A5B7HQL1_PORTR|nr:hypothetical protein [Portunus trituberculatus]
MHLPHTHPSHIIQNRKMVTLNPTLEFPSGQGTINVPSNPPQIFLH